MPVLQFEEQFGAQSKHSLCADFFHTVEYAAGAAKACQYAQRHPWRLARENLALLTALITIRQSCWWDDFWEWLDERDKKRFRLRLLGGRLNRFRGPRRPRLVTEDSESLELDGLSPMSEGPDGPTRGRHLEPWRPSARSPMFSAASAREGRPLNLDHTPPPGLHLRSRADRVTTSR